MIYVTGDLHGEIDIAKLSQRLFHDGKHLCKNDYLIILGDFGLVWKNVETDVEKYWLDWLESKKWTTLFIDGNHENFPRLLTYPETERFGGTVGELRPSVFHLKQRGAVYNIYDDYAGKSYKCWSFGGAQSHDKSTRIEGRSWWKDEMPSLKEYEFGIKSLQSANNEVDFIFSHEAPTKVINEMAGFCFEGDGYELTRYFQQVADETKFKTWFFGHHHLDRKMNIDGKSFQALYWEVRKIGHYGWD